jgi:hypothetical protein
LRIGGNRHVGHTHQLNNPDYRRGRGWQCRRYADEGGQSWDGGNTIAGAVGGLGGGQLLQALIPALAGAAGGSVDLGSIIGQVVGSGIGGAILTVIAALVKNAMANR